MRPTKGVIMEEHICNCEAKIIEVAPLRSLASWIIIGALVKTIVKIASPKPQK